MINKQKVTFTVITVLVGFMLAVQFQTNQKPVVRDTRDIWQLREDLKKEQKLQRQLINEIQKKEQVLKEYAGSTERKKIESLQQQKEELMEKVGLTKVSGRGIILTVEPLMTEFMLGEGYYTIPPQLLSRLINELNRYNAEAVAIAGQRIISISPIRDVNNMTYVNSSPLPPLPIEIKVLSKKPEQLHNRMIVSQSIDEFAIENLKLTSTIVPEVTLPAYEEPIRIKYMKAVESSLEEKKGS